MNNNHVNIYLFIYFVDEQVIITTMENWMIERGSNNRTYRSSWALNPFETTVSQVEHSILAKIAEKFGQKWVNLKNEIFVRSRISIFFCARRSVIVILNLSESLAKPLVMAKLNMAYLSSLKNRAKLLYEMGRGGRMGG